MIVLELARFSQITALATSVPLIQVTQSVQLLYSDYFQLGLMVRFCRKAKHQLLKILTSGFSETETRVFAFNDSFQEKHDDK